MTDALQFEVDMAFDVDHYLYFTSDLVDDALSRREVRFMSDVLRLTGASAVLDLPCGHGRHSNLLAEITPSVTGVDTNKSFLDIARAQARAKGVSVEYLCEDMRHIDCRAAFDAVIMVFTSFAMFDHRDNMRVLENMARALRTGGRYCIELMNAAPLTATYRRDYVFEKDGNLMIDRLSYHPQANRFVSNRVYIKDGQRRDAVMSHEIFSLEQMQVAMQALGLSVDEVYASCTGEVFQATSDKMILVGTAR
jgi:SAM-dependent methyltransferase